MMIFLSSSRRAVAAFARPDALGITGGRRIQFRRFSSLPIVSCKYVDGDDNGVESSEVHHKKHQNFIQFSTSVKQPSRFRVTAKYAAAGDQPAAIQQLTQQLQAGDRFSILRGVTGTGKTFVMSHLISNLNKPCLVLCHNKTLAAQLARELRSFFQQNAVELFVSYYNHYVPESFVETTGKYTAKKSSVNAEIDALRHRATRALLTRSDVVVVASVSCIFGLGLPKEYLNNSLELFSGSTVSWFELSNKLDSMLYDVSMDDDNFARGQYQVEERFSVNDMRDTNVDDDGARTFTRTVILWPPHDRFPMQIQLQQQQGASDQFRVSAIRVGSQAGLTSVSSFLIFPAKHHVISEDRLDAACVAIEDEMRGRVRELTSEGKFLESERLQRRVTNDLMMLRETGFCAGGENYSRHFAGRAAGEPPDTLLDYFSSLSGQRDWLLIVDESHVTLPQLSAMYAGDQARKQRLVKHGFRLSSALDNRPLQACEFWQQVEQAVFVSATPGKPELEMAEHAPVEMVIRPTFVCDPVIEVRPAEGQLEDLLREVKNRALMDQRTLAVALTKRDAEDLSSYLIENGVSSTYIHSGLTTHERSDALKALQSGQVDCLVGVNLLREGLDLPQVSLVAILSADSEGFLRSETALFQSIGRAARNTEGMAILYAKRVTDSMRKCIEETKSRRMKQLEHNEKYGEVSQSTKGSSTMSIFDLAKDEIDAETPLVVAGRKRQGCGHTQDFIAELPIQSPLKVQSNSLTTLTTDHIPSSPGIYIWRDSNDEVLYIGKAANLRSRVRSYHSSKSRHSPRIKVMLQKAASVDFVLTPSERDALVLESNLIKHHQPPYNVLLKDDEHYPYICASCGDAFPRLFVAPLKVEGLMAKQQYRYFGPYTSFKEINAILEMVEVRYDLRAKSFLARHGVESQEEYQCLFDKVMQDVFSESNSDSQEECNTLRSVRLEYEEAGLLFDSKFNQCRDVVAVGRAGEGDSSIVVHVLQLRDGLVAGRFSYTCHLLGEGATEDDYADAIYKVLADRHYPSGGENRGGFSWFPNDIMLSHIPDDIKGLRIRIRQLRSKKGDVDKKPITISTAAKRKGSKREVDSRVLEFATKNAHQAALERSVGDMNIAVVDGSGADELADLVGSDKAPSRIECYDVSHSQGDFAVASRVVFIDGKPAPHLYRKFNIKTVQGVDDYASLEEVLERRFQRALQNDSINTGSTDDTWTLPDLVVIDGGKGQLASAIRGMTRAGLILVGVPAEAGDCITTFQEQSSVAVCALAKNEEQVYIHGKNTPVNNSPDSPALLLLRALRDESHRFALTAHRTRRSIRKSR